jgi:hypothetical protein
LEIYSEDSYHPIPGEVDDDPGEKTMASVQRTMIALQAPLCVPHFLEFAEHYYHATSTRAKFETHSDGKHRMRLDLEPSLGGAPSPPAEVPRRHGEARSKGSFRSHPQAPSLALPRCDHSLAAMPKTGIGLFRQARSPAPRDTDLLRRRFQAPASCLAFRRHPRQEIALHTQFPLHPALRQ